MRIVEAAEIEVAIEKLCIEANIFLNEDIKNALVRGIEKEESDTGRSVLRVL